MDENQVFPPKQDAEQPGTTQAPVDQPAEAAPVSESDPFAAPADPNAVGTEAAPVDGTTDAATAEATEGETAAEEPPPPPSKAGLIKKILIGLGVLLVIIFLVVLFMPKGQSSKEVKLVWWGLWEDPKAVELAINDFERANPTIKIEYVKQDPKQYRSRLEARIQNGTGPDVFRFHNSWAPLLTKQLLPLSTDVITPQEFQKAFHPVMQKDLTLNGAIYGIPVGADTLAMFANTELFDKAGVQVPTTWRDFVIAARRLTVKDPDTQKIKTAGAALGTYNNVTHASDIVSMLFVQQGIDIKAITDPKNIEKEETALDFYSGFAKGDQNVWDNTLDESVLAFARGNLGLYFGYSWDVFRIQRINKNLQFKVFQVPGLEGGNPQSIASYWAEGVSAKSKNKKEALLFIKYLAQKETAQKLYTEQSKIRSFGEPYARADLADSLKEQELVYPFVKQLPYASSTYFASATQDGEGGLNSALNAYLANAVTSLANNEEAPDTAAKNLNKGISQVYKKYGIKAK